MLADANGAIVNNLSANALAPSPLIPAYSISKAAAVLAAAAEVA